MDIKDLEGDPETGLQVLIRSSVKRLRELCGGRPRYSVVWKRKDGKGDAVRISCRKGPVLYVHWSALGAYPPRGMSRKIAIGTFLREYERVKKGRER